MQKSALTNKQAAIWVSGLCFLSAGFLSAWTVVRARGDQLSAQNNMQLSARKKYIQQAAKWDRELSTEQLRHLMDERRDRSIQRGLDEGIRGAATMAALMGMFLGAIKGAQFKGLAKSFLKSPLVSFHLVRAILYFAPARSCAVGMGTCVCPRTPVPSAPCYVCMHVLLCVGARVSHLILSDLGRDTCVPNTFRTRRRSPFTSHPPGFGAFTIAASTRSPTKDACTSLWVLTTSTLSERARGSICVRTDNLCVESVSAIKNFFGRIE